MSGDQLVPFLFGGESMVRVVIRGGGPWFVALDVCGVLGIAKHRNAVSRLADDERGSVLVDTLGGQQEVAAVSESGLYALIFRSRKPKAIEFRKWVTSEVLPTIRQTGSYTPRATIEPPPYPEGRVFPEWPLEEMRTKGNMVSLYRLTYGPPAAQWIMPQLGFPMPPKHLITEGKQLSFMLVTPTDEPAPEEPA
jgi:hypothetical protein